MALPSNSISRCHVSGLWTESMRISVRRDSPSLDRFRSRNLNVTVAFGGSGGGSVRSRQVRARLAAAATAAAHEARPETTMELSAAGQASGGYRGLDRRGGGGRGDGKRGDGKRGDGSGARLVDAWLASSQDGYCATTEEGEGDCVAGTQVASSFLIWTASRFGRSSRRLRIAWIDAHGVLAAYMSPCRSKTLTARGTHSATCERCTRTSAKAGSRAAVCLVPGCSVRPLRATCRWRCRQRLLGIIQRRRLSRYPPNWSDPVSVERWITGFSLIRAMASAPRRIVSTRATAPLGIEASSSFGLAKLAPGALRPLAAWRDAGRARAARTSLSFGCRALRNAIGSRRRRVRNASSGFQGSAAKRRVCQQLVVRP